MDTNELQEINKEAAIKDLNISLKEAEFLEKTDLPKTIAPLIYAAYRKGVDEYQTKYWSGPFRAQAFQRHEGTFQYGGGPVSVRGKWHQ